jgi:hypothetical protein
MMEALRSSETSVLTNTTRRNILEGSILHSQCRGNLRSYKGNSICVADILAENQTHDLLNTSPKFYHHRTLCFTWR